MLSFPLLNIWSAYSLLQSTWDISVGLSELHTLGYESAGLADYLSLAASEHFDREARLRHIQPWLGISRHVQISTASCLVSLYALDETGWQELCGMTQDDRVADIEQVASPHLLLLLWHETRSDWEPVLPLIRSLPFGVIVEELVPNMPSHDLLWIPLCPVRFNRHPGAAQAYQVLTRLGNHKPSGFASSIQSPEQLLQSYPTQWRSRLFQDPAPDVLPRRGFYMPSFSSSAKDDEEILWQKARAGLKAWHPEPFSHYQERLQHELQIITDMGYASYFLIVQDLVDFAAQHHIAIGPGRGSAAGSLVARVLGITRIDPLQHHLIFERFLNPYRKNLPDIDLDVDSQKRYQLIAYLRQRWGEDHVAQIGTYGTLGVRAVLRDVARVLGISGTQVDEVLRYVQGIAALRIDDGGAELRTLMDRIDSSGQWWTLSRLLEGLPRHASVHAAGVVLSNRPLGEFIPCVKDPDGQLVTQMDMTSVEHLGLLKLDLLGLRTLSVIDRVHRDHEDMFDQVDRHDERTLRLLGRGDTDAIFQLDGKGVRQLLQRMKPQRAEDIIDVVALYRPGPMETIQTYLERRQGQQPIPDDVLGSVCQDTFGVMIYQEQLMTLVQRVGGYSLAEADLFRRAISKKDHQILANMASDFMTRALRLGWKREEIQSLWERITAFADYGFNKSHAAAYGMLSYYIAFLKAHFPLHFWAAELSTLSPDRLIHEMIAAVSQGIVIRPPDIRYSGEEFHVIGGEEIYAGLSVVRGLNVAIAEQIRKEREEGGAYSSQQEAYQRISRRVGGRVADLLQEAGCLAELPGHVVRSSQLELFSTDKAEKGLRVDAIKSFGLGWPVANGPIYVRITGAVDVRWWQRALSDIAQKYPGSCPVIIGNEKGRAWKFETMPMKATWQSLDAIRQLPNVIACGRRVEQKEGWNI